MLVLTRKVKERIHIGTDIVITILRIGPGRVQIGIEAPPHLRVLRGDLVAGAWPSATVGVQEK
jgi:carbon storage regulator